MEFPTYLPDRPYKFVGREDYIMVISQIFNSTKMVAISAFGGTGKSTLTLEYSHRLLENNKNSYIRWFNSGSRLKFELDLRHFAQELDVNTDEVDMNDIKWDLYKQLKEFQSDILFVRQIICRTNYINCILKICLKMLKF